MLLADTLMETQTEIDGKWVIAKPYSPSLIWRIKDAIAVLKGKASAVRFYKQ